MLHILKLLLPALLPSWNFFDVIAPSPRIQFALMVSENEPPLEWQEFRPRPAHLSFMQMLRRMTWNPRWNESLFMLSCAERLMEHPTQHSENEILKRIMNELKRNTPDTRVMAATHLQFRLLIVQRKDSRLLQKVTFNSHVEPLCIRDTA